MLNLSSHLGLGSRRKAAPGAPLSNGGRNGRYTRRSVECICSRSGGRFPTRCGLHYQYLEKITCSPLGGLEEIHMAPSHCRIDHVPKIRDGISECVSEASMYLVIIKNGMGAERANARKFQDYSGDRGNYKYAAI